MKDNKRKTLGGIPLIFIAVVLIAMVLSSRADRDSDLNLVNENSQVVADAPAHHFKNEKLLNEHYEKHGVDMGFSTAEEYEKAASDVVNNITALHKIEKEDGDDVYYIEATNEFVVVSGSGYIRTYFCPDAGKAYFDRQ